MPISTRIFSAEDMFSCSMIGVAIFLHIASQYLVVKSQPSTFRNCSILRDINILEINFTACQILHIRTAQIELNGTLVLSENSAVILHGSNTTVSCSKNSGIFFQNVDVIEMRSVTFIKCGILHSYRIDPSSTVKFQSALHFVNVSHIGLYEFTISQSEGTGLVLLNCKQVLISDSKFINNSWHKNSSQQLAVAGGGGIHLEITCTNNTQWSASHCNMTNTTIENSCFFSNHARNFTAPGRGDFGEVVFTSFGKGGGLSVHIRDNANGNQVSVINCKFNDNLSKYGGGAEIVFSNKVSHNTVTIENCSFSWNKAINSSGALDIGFVGKEINRNDIFISNTNFTSNSASSGGAVSLFFLYTFILEQSSISFANVKWTSNEAHYGAVLFAYPLYTQRKSIEPKVVFENITVTNNAVYKKNESKGVKLLGEGIIMTTKQSLIFKGHSIFKHNQGSCVYATSSIVYFHVQEAEFFQNSAMYGAAFSLIGFSSINLGNNTIMVFCNNSVSHLGSIIYYYSIDKTSYEYSRFCFLEWPSATQSLRIYFYGNTAGGTLSHGNVSSIIYASTFTSCVHENFVQFHNSGVIQWSDTCTSCYPLSFALPLDYHFYHCNDTGLSANTSESFCTGIESRESNVTLSVTNISFTPGIAVLLPIQVGSDFLCDSDDSHKEYSFFISIKNSPNSSIASLTKYLHRNSKKDFILTGSPGDTGKLILTESGLRKLELSIEVTALNCPPLFVLNNNKCQCVTSNTVPYPEFHTCKTSHAQIRLGFWVGYEESSAGQSVLLISHCPPGFCSKDTKDNYIPLPETRDLSELSDRVCHNREGRLCGLCKTNYAVYFHAKTFECKPTNQCSLGLLFYVLSEIFPLTLLFLTVIFFDIRLTAGYLNGFVFFAQMYNSITQIGEAFVSKPPLFHKLSGFHRVVYKYLDFDFFAVEGLSFCLFRTKSALAIVAFKYVTVIYALSLVVGTVWVLNKFGTKLKCMGARQFKYSALQGLSAFLVMVYSQCTQVSFAILNFVNVHKDNGNPQIVPILQGNIDYFSRSHLIYAIPAMLCIFTVVVALPVLLLTYPLLPKVIFKLHLENNSLVRAASKLFPVSKLKPLFDSLQGSFKDELRFFAGFYFIYRVAIIATILQDRIEWIHTAIEIELVLILCIHVIAWPYQNKMHNIIDCLLFCNLTLIVILKHFTFVVTEKGFKFESEIKKLLLSQLIFINIPLAVILLKLLCIFVNKVRNFLNRRRNKGGEEHCNLQTHWNDSILDDNSRETIEGSYMLMKEKRFKEIMN